MNAKTFCTCSTEMQGFLDGSLSPERLSALEEHLSTCEECLKTIYDLAGDTTWWSDVESALGDDPTLNDFSIADELVTEEDDEPPASLPLRGILELLGPTDDPQFIGRIGPYEIAGLIGQGGMGAVFKAFDAGLNRYVAIKVLLPHLSASGAAKARFRREGQAAAAVVNDHVLPIYAVDQYQGAPYLVMQYIRGTTLQKRLTTEGPLPPNEILRIAHHAARGLAAAHEQGLVHRDVKPSNILLQGGVDRAILSDFGLARAADDASLTRSGMLAGTPQFMSPEQVLGDRLDQRSDLFSLGSVIYAMCTGHPPFRAESSYAVLRRITDQMPRPICEINPAITTPNFGMAIEITEAGSKGKGKNQKHAVLGSAVKIVELDGTEEETQDSGPISTTWPKFDRQYPGTSGLYVHRTKDVEVPLKEIHGELKISSGMKLEAVFPGTQPQQQKVNGEVFALKSVQETQGGLAVVVSFPPTSAMRKSRNMLEKMQAAMTSLQSYELEIEDKEGNILVPSGSSAAGSGGGGSQGAGFNGRTQFRSTQTEPDLTTMTFYFQSLPLYSIANITARVVETDGEVETVPFTIQVDAE